MSYTTSPVWIGGVSNCTFSIQVINGYRKDAIYIRHETSTSSTLDYVLEDSQFDLRVRYFAGIIMVRVTHRSMIALGAHSGCIPWKYLPGCLCLWYLCSECTAIHICAEAFHLWSTPHSTELVHGWYPVPPRCWFCQLTS